MNKFTYSLVTFRVRRADAGEHDLLPSLAGCRPEEDQQRPEERLEVVVPVDVRVVVLGDPAEHLHPDDAVDEEDEGDEEADPGEGLEGLEKGPEKGSDAFVFVEQFDKTRHTEQTEKTDRG